MEFTGTIVCWVLLVVYILKWDIPRERQIIFKYTFVDTRRVSKLDLIGCNIDSTVDSRCGLSIIYIYRNKQADVIDLHAWNIAVIGRDILLLSCKTIPYSTIIEPCMYKGLKVINIAGSEAIYKYRDYTWQIKK